MQAISLVSLALLVHLNGFFHIRSTESVKVKFTNLKCEVFQATFLSFKECSLKALSRDTVSLNIYAQMHQLPIDNVTLNVQLFVKGNGYRPFLYNNTFDLCDFVEKPNRFMFWKIVYSIVKPFTNLNHSCPFDHDIMIREFILNGDMFKLIPFPPDDYMVHVQFAAYNHYKAKAKFYFKMYN